MSIVSVTLSKHLILCRPLFLLPSIFPSIRHQVYHELIRQILKLESGKIMKTDNWGTSLVAQSVKNLSAMQETQVWSLDGEDLLKKKMTTHSRILAWRIPWTEEPGRLQSMGSPKVGHDWATKPPPSGDPVTETLGSQCRGPGFDAWLGN